MYKLKLKKWLSASVATAGLCLFGLTLNAYAAESSSKKAIYVDSVQPYYGDVAEDQVFILRFNQAIKDGVVLARSYCQSSALGERIPLRVLPPDQAIELLTEQSYEYTPETASEYVVAQCAQRLAPGSKVRLQLFDAQGHNLVPRAFREDSTGLAFTVRNPLRAQLICDKTKSTADCNPLRPLVLRFSAPVSAEIAQQLQLVLPDSTVLNAQKQPDLFIDELVFPAPLVSQAQLRWQLPSNWSVLKDDAGRALANTTFFEQPVKIAALAPLLKFAHTGIGVVERFANEPAAPDAAPALLPLAVRGVEPSLLNAEVKKSAGQLHHLRLSSPLEMLQWYGRLNTLDTTTHSLFDGLSSTDQIQRISLPGVPNSQEKDIELIGIPLVSAGLHILEAQSSRLGATYNEDNADMYVQSAALVTNLAVHSKLSTDQLMVWVTRLDTGKPVNRAQITVLSCDGQLLASGLTDAQGRWVKDQSFDDDYCSETRINGLFITAAITADHADAYGQDDTSFVLSSSDDGIESWRFQLPYFYGSDQSDIAHTVTDRPLFLAGETVHLKHYWRGDPDTGLALDQRLPDLLIRHVGSGDETKQKLHWQSNPTGGWYALSTVELAKNTTLGEYNVWLQGKQHQFNTASFYVEAFKLPYLVGKLNLTGTDAKPLVGAAEALVDIQLNYISGGVAADQKVQISAVTQTTTPTFSAYGEYSFEPEQDESRPMVMVDKVPLVLDSQGAATLPIPLAPTPNTNAKVKSLVVEASFMDPNGQIQSLSQRQTLWPAEVVVGVNHPYWEQGTRFNLKGVVVDPSGQPVPQQDVSVTGQKQHYYTTRQRMVGGFYRYDSHEELEEIGQLCQTQTNTKGEWQCEVSVVDGGQLILQSHAADKQGRGYTTISSIWLSGESDFASNDNHDRIDIIADQKTAEPGQKVRFQVTMPFAQATALVAVEQDKVLYTEVVHLSRAEPFFDLTVQDDWGPNVYVSVLALRGRQYASTWQSFLDGGWKTPLDWYSAYKNNEVTTPSTHVDLAKPSFRYGIAQLQVPNIAHEIKVTLQSEKKVYEVGQTAKVTLRATLPDGQPAASASVLLVGVDQALLSLMPNQSWALLDAMYPAIGYGVRTATMQSQVIGKRHFGRKAVAAGGGGGGAPTREILDSLLIWRTDVLLDSTGTAVIDIPLNDSITEFELVALVDSGGSQFGVAKTQIQTHQSIQIMSGLPAVVRTGDQYDAVFTIRNRDAEKISIALEAQGSVNGQVRFNLPVLTQEIKAQSSAIFKQKIIMPPQLDAANDGQITWTITAHNTQTKEMVDQLVFDQAWQAQVPVTTQQVIWQRLLPNQPVELALSRPETALQYEGQYLGGAQLRLQPSLGGQDTVKAWFEQYPYTCFEQQASKYVALHDTASWQRLMQELPAYLDSKNLLRYFPSPYLTGNAGLNAYILRLNAYSPDQVMLPEPLVQKLLQGLHDYVQGRQDQPRTSAYEQVAFYLAALDALARYEMVPPHRLDTIALEIAQWPTSALIDALSILDTPAQTQQRQRVEQELQQRLVQRGSALMFTDDNPLNSMPALMVSAVSNQASLILAVADQPTWQPRLAALAHGLLAQQRRGHWGTTTANSLALLALERVDQHAEAQGQTTYRVGETTHKQIDWRANPQAQVVTDWDWSQNGALHIEQEGNAATPLWLQLSAKAAVPVTMPITQGYQIQRTVKAIQQAQLGQWQVGDIYEVTLTLTAEHSSVWAVVNDAIPPGAMILDMASENALSPSYIERLFTGYRAYIEYLPAGVSVVRYRVRLNTAGEFELPPTAIESLYDDSVQAQLPVAKVKVHAVP